MNEEQFEQIIELMQIQLVSLYEDASEATDPCLRDMHQEDYEYNKGIMYKFAEHRNIDNLLDDIVDQDTNIREMFIDVFYFARDHFGKDDYL